MIVEIWKCDSHGKFPSNIGAFFIKTFQGTDYTHFTLKIKNNGTDIDADDFFDATLLHGVTNRSAESFFRDYKLVGKPWEIEVGTYLDFVCAINPYLGKKYGLIQAFGLGLKWLFKWSKNPFRNGVKQVICNELVLRFTDHFMGTESMDFDNLTLLETEKRLDALLYKG